MGSAAASSSTDPRPNKHGEYGKADELREFPLTHSEASSRNLTAYPIAKMLKGFSKVICRCSKWGFIQLGKSFPQGRAKKVPPKVSKECSVWADWLPRSVGRSKEGKFKHAGFPLHNLYLLSSKQF